MSEKNYNIFRNWKVNLIIFLLISGLFFFQNQVSAQSSFFNQLLNKIAEVYSQRLEEKIEIGATAGSREWILSPFNGLLRPVNTATQVVIGDTATTSQLTELEIKGLTWFRGGFSATSTATVTPTFHTPEVCINNSCRTTWPTGGAGGAAWEKYTTLTSPANIVTPTTTDASIFVSGNATTTGNFAFMGEILPDGLECSNNQILKKTGANDWDCAADETGTGGVNDWKVIWSGATNQALTPTSTNNNSGLFITSSSTVQTLRSDTLTVASSFTMPNPTDCSANQFANAIGTNANLTCAAIGDADVPDNITITEADPVWIASNWYLHGRQTSINSTTTNIDTLKVYVGSTFPANDIVDAEVSDTLTCSDLVAGSAVVADSEVVDTLTLNTSIEGIFSGNLRSNWINASSTLFDNATTTHLGLIGFNSCTALETNSTGSVLCGADDTGAGGGVNDWRVLWSGATNQALTPTSTNNLTGLFITASSTIAANFRVDGNATTTGRSIFGATQPTNNYGVNGLWVSGEGFFNGGVTTTHNFASYGSVTSTSISVNGNFVVSGTGTATTSSRSTVGLAAAGDSTLELYDSTTLAYVLGNYDTGNLFIIASSTTASGDINVNKLFTLDASGNSTTTGTIHLPGLAAGAGGDYAVCINNTTKMITNAGATGCIVSSKRYKENIEPLNVGLAELLQLKPSQFNLKGSSIKEMGLIAEDVDLVDKRLVGYEADGITPRVVKYEQLTALIINGIKHIWRDIQTLWSWNLDQDIRISELEKQNEDLLKRIEILEKKK